jgi:aminocarboxymuconate-semialdehyde decarboxylase
LYFDSVVFDADALRFLAGKAGAARIMLGSNMPFPMGDMEPCKVVQAAGLGEPERAAILGGNAQGVFRIRPDCWCRG